MEILFLNQVTLRISITKRLTYGHHFVYYISLDIINAQEDDIEVMGKERM